MAADTFATIPVDGAQIACRCVGSGRPLLVLNGFAATSADWDPSFVDGLASANKLILIDNRGIGASADNGAPFDIAKLADDSARVIEMLGFERASVLGWSMGGFIAQKLAVQYPDRVDKLILLSTDSGGPDAELASPFVRSQLTDMSGTPHEQARRLLSLLFPSDLADSIYREFGDMGAAARAKLSPDLVRRQGAAMDAWHADGVGDRLRELSLPALVATGNEDVVIPASNALRLVNAIPSARLAQFKGGGHAFMAQYPHQLADLVNAVPCPLTDSSVKSPVTSSPRRPIQRQRRSTRPRFPAFADRPGVIVDVDLFQALDAIFHCVC